MMSRLKQSRLLIKLRNIALYSLAVLGVLFILLLIFVPKTPRDTNGNFIPSTPVTSEAIVIVPTFTPTSAKMPALSSSAVPTSSPKSANALKPTSVPTIAPTTTPISGVTLDSANLRAGPGTTYPISGSLAAGQTVTIVAKNDAGDWYQLDSKAWVAAFLVNVGGVVADSPTPNSEPKVLTFSEIRAIADTATDAQWNLYSASLKGKFVINWTGWVDDVTEKVFAGGYEVLIDMDSPNELFSLYDVTFDVSNSQALKFSKNSQIIFSGKIKRVFKLLGAMTIELTDVGVVPSDQ